MRIEALLSLLQLHDGVFPSGGYAHSFGLETYVQGGQVASREDVAGFLHSFLELAAAPSDAALAVLVRDRANQGDLEGCLDLDGLLDSMKPVRELREASRQMGRQTLRILTELEDHPVFENLSQAATAGDTPAHHAVVLGVAGGIFDWSASETSSAFLYASAALVVGAALRLLPLGQTDGQRILYGARDQITRLSTEVDVSKPDELWSFTPGIDLAGMKHADLDARLFRS